jgi:hypothetical protein
MQQREFDPGFGVHYTILCSMHIECPSFISVIVQMEILTECPNCAGIKNIMTIYACGNVNIYLLQSVLSYPHPESCEINSHRSASFFGQTGSDLK